MDDEAFPVLVPQALHFFFDPHEHILFSGFFWENEDYT